ncbi:hypothetical protein COPG_00095 [Colwellia phage 9A]|uniref:Uncharacterized protein n=1 Tax=Colwellia phage 9A TaxID=765765 RepID=I3UMH6_9CAUD|nr:hypothetical protein COPG_00095 [Colwellia phage 9A]AFK66691.1 hypothetical protein COPG_00095 [Colwellia phage 9A]
MKEFILANQETLIQCGLIILTLIAVMLVIRWLTTKPVLSDEEVFAMPQEKQLIIKQKHLETRYLTKKVSKNNQDLNRYGRFSVTYENGDVKTKMGMLSAVLSDSSIESYKEIK